MVPNQERKLPWALGSRLLYGASFYRHDKLNRWPHEEISLQFLSSSRGQKSGWKFQPSVDMLGLSSVARPSLEAIKGLIVSHLISTNSGRLSRGLLWVTRDPPITQKIPRVCGALCQDLRTNASYIPSITERERHVKYSPELVGAGSRTPWLWILWRDLKNTAIWVSASEVLL